MSLQFYSIQPKYIHNKAKLVNKTSYSTIMNFFLWNKKQNHMTVYSKMWIVVTEWEKVCLVALRGSQENFNQRIDKIQIWDKGPEVLTALWEEKLGSPNKKGSLS